MDFVRKTPPLRGQVIDFEQFVREIPLFTDKLSILSQPYSVIRGLRDNKSGKGPSEGLTRYH